MVNTEIKNTFTDIYENNLWLGDDKHKYYSGFGSHDPKFTIPYIDMINRFIDDYDIKTVIDFGCGDFNIGKEIICNRYIGCDVVEEMINDHNRTYANDDTIQFVLCDGVEENIPNGDLFLAKEVFQHLSYDTIKQILSKINKFKFAIITNSYNIEGEHNVVKETNDANTFEYTYGLYLDEEPFNLPKGIKLLSIPKYSDNCFMVSTLFSFENI